MAVDMDISSQRPALSRSKTNPRFIAVVLLVLFSGFVAWASLVPLAKGVVAPGTVVVDSQRKTIQHLEGGVIRAIHVREGSQVEKENILLELDDTKARAERDMVRSRYWMKLAVLDRLKSLQTSASSLVFRKELTSIRDNTVVRELMVSQTHLFDVLHKEHTGKKLILGQRIEQMREKSKGLVSLRDATEKQIALLGREIERLQKLQEKHLVESSVVVDRLQLITQQQGELGKTISSLSEAQVALGESELTLVQAEKEWQQSLADQLSETQEAVIELKSQLNAAENVLARTVIRAPQAGIVLGLKIHTIGGVVSPANPIMDIVPQGDELVIEARILPLDIDSVIPGMGAQVRFSSFRARTTPQLNSTVEHVSADAMTDPVDGSPFYLARIIVNETEIAKLSGLTVIPGMPAEVFIDAGSRTMTEYLFDPLMAVFRKGMREE
uniref:Membrane fusion protein (MFP) family protein n=1 Tax=Candidatus Kentrum sp. DK TaxID=2126562 RepID=A0A450SXH1_9GAMM|nr:MAG: HlyD family secretion protein/membrane fusion protein, epimerase transport system [Candidatus Kentron sp. DK]